MVTHAIATEQHHTEHVRVTRWDIAAGASTGMHRHGYDYVVVPAVEATMLLTFPDGTSARVDLQPGVSYMREAGAEHDVSNPGPAHVTFVEIELLHCPG